MADSKSSADSQAAVHTAEARKATRNQIAEDIEQFLQDGGQVQEIEHNVRADPPKKPENNYGRGSI